MVETDSAIREGLNVENITIRRGPKVLLEYLSFSANPGDLIWITGTNGSGKTSLLKCIAGLLRQDTGVVDWQDANSSIAYLGHNDGHKGELTVCENLKFWQSIFQGAPDLEATMKRAEIWHLKDLPAKRLSAGQSRRVALARLLLKNAQLWLLDEPAAPMDRKGRDLIADLIEDHISSGRIALIATHSTPLKIGTNAQVLNLGAGADG